MILLQLMIVGTLSTPVPAGPRIAPVGFTQSLSTPADTVTRKRARTKTVEYSDAYYLNLKIHKIASYAELPLFATEYVLGERLLKERRTGTPSDGLKTAHTTIALGLGALFTINTITGVWTLWDARHDPAGRTRRIIHSVAMLGADAGFMWAGASGGGANDSLDDANHHRSIAISSMALATVGTAMMWFLPD